MSDVRIVYEKLELVSWLGYSTTMPGNVFCEECRWVVRCPKVRFGPYHFAPSPYDLDLCGCVRVGVM